MSTTTISRSTDTSSPNHSSDDPASDIRPSVAVPPSLRLSSSSFSPSTTSTTTCTQSVTAPSTQFHPQHIVHSHSTATAKTVASNSAATGTTTSPHTDYTLTQSSISSSQKRPFLPSHLPTFPYYSNITYMNGTPVAQVRSTSASTRNSFPPSSVKPTLTVPEYTNPPVDIPSHPPPPPPSSIDLKRYLTSCNTSLQTTTQPEPRNELESIRNHSCDCCISTSTTAAAAASVAASAASTAASAATAAAVALSSLSDSEHNSTSRRRGVRNSRHPKFRHRPFSRWTSSTPSPTLPFTQSSGRNQNPSLSTTSLRHTAYSRRRRRTIHAVCGSPSAAAQQFDLELTNSVPDLSATAQTPHQPYRNCRSLHRNNPKQDFSESDLSSQESNISSCGRSFPESFPLPFPTLDPYEGEEDFSYPLVSLPHRRHSCSPRSLLSLPQPKDSGVSSNAAPTPTPTPTFATTSVGPKDAGMLRTTAIHPVTSSVLTEKVENTPPDQTSTYESSAPDQPDLPKANYPFLDGPKSNSMPPLTPSLVRPAHVPRLNNLPSWSDATARLQPHTVESYGTYDVHPHDVRITDLHSFPISTHSFPRSHIHSHHSPTLTQFDYHSDSNPQCLFDTQAGKIQKTVSDLPPSKQLAVPLKQTIVSPPQSPSASHSPYHHNGDSAPPTHSLNSPSPTLSRSLSSTSGASSPSLEAHSLETMRMRSANDFGAEDDTLTFTDDDYATAIDADDCRLEPSLNEAEHMDGVHYQDENEHSTEEENESDDPEMRPATPLNYFVHNGLRYDGDVYELRPPQERSIASRPERILEHKPAPLSHRQIFNRVYSEGTFNARPSSLRHSDVPPSPETSESQTNDTGTDGDGDADGRDDPQIPAIPVAGVHSSTQTSYPLIDTPAQSRPPLPVTRPPSVRPTDGGLADVQEKLMRLAAATAAVAAANNDMCSSMKISQSRVISGGDAFCDEEKESVSMADVGVTTGDMLVDENGIPVVNPSVENGKGSTSRRGPLSRYTRRKTTRSYGPFSANGAGSPPGKSSRVPGDGAQHQRKNSLWKLLSR